jgi:hypothetical protein
VRNEREKLKKGKLNGKKIKGEIDESKIQKQKQGRKMLIKTKVEKV